MKPNTSTTVRFTVLRSDPPHNCAKIVLELHCPSQGKQILQTPKRRFYWATFSKAVSKKRLDMVCLRPIATMVATLLHGCVAPHNL